MADPTTKSGKPRIGRVVATNTNRGRRYDGPRDCCAVEWENDTRKHGSPRRSDVPVVIMDKIEERDIVRHAPDRVHRIARIIDKNQYQPDRGFGLSWDAYREPVQLIDGTTTAMRHLCMGIRIDADSVGAMMELLPDEYGVHVRYGLYREGRYRGEVWDADTMVAYGFGDDRADAMRAALLQVIEGGGHE